MTTYVVLLRAINVGGHNKIPMVELRELLAELGFDNVATYVQSGNVVCSSAKKPPGVASTIKAGVAEHFGHDIEVIARTAAELEAIVSDFPYPDADPRQSGVVFLSDSFDAELDAAAFAPDECLVAGSHVYVHLPSGFGKTKLTNDWVEKQTGLAGTRRNWNTVLKLAELIA